MAPYVEHAEREGYCMRCVYDSAATGAVLFRRHHPRHPHVLAERRELAEAASAKLIRLGVYTALTMKPAFLATRNLTLAAFSALSENERAVLQRHYEDWLLEQTAAIL